MSRDVMLGAVKWFICEDGHLHMTFLDENEKEVFSTAMDIDFWCDLADDIDGDIEQMIDASNEATGATKH